MYSFKRTEGWYDGRPVAAGFTPSKLISAKSRVSTNRSITRTGLLSSMKSSRHSGNSVDCPRSTSSTKRLINSPPESRENHNSGTAFSHSQGQNRKSSTRAHVFRFAPESGHCATESACPFRALPDIGWRSLLMVTHGLPPPKRKPSMLAEKPNNRSDPRRVVGRKSKVLIVLKRGGAA